MANQEQRSQEWPPKLAVCVGAVVLQRDQALFVRQAKGHSLEGQWSIPWGIVDPEETPESAAMRETEEEGGVKAEIKGLLGFQNQRRVKFYVLSRIMDDGGCL
jgi:ADP-ribose pyrophosphatase YjhB (NUDIX family)